jgi:hypothetical protein
MKTVRILSLEDNGSPAVTATTCTSKCLLGTLYEKYNFFCPGKMYTRAI